MKQIMMMVVTGMLLLTFSGCTSKETPSIPKVVCMEQKVLDKIEILEISIFEDDLEYFEAKRDAIYEQLDFYIEQVKDHNKMCEVINNAIK